MRSSLAAMAASCCVLSLISTVLALPSLQPIGQNVTALGQMSVKPACHHDFPNNTWLENLAVRSNGQVLVTLITSPDLYLLSPSTPSSPPTLVHHFANHLSLFGIAELTRDKFYVIAGNYSQPDNHNTPGAWDVYCVDLCEDKPKVGLVKHFGNATLLNGMAALPDGKGVLVGDAGAGKVYRLDAATGKVDVAMDEELMKPPVGAPVGIDGLQIHASHLYYTNAPRGLLVRVPIHASGLPSGPSEVLLRDVEVDDFTLDATGALYLTVFYKNQIQQYEMGQGNATVWAGPSHMLSGPTACKFGRGEEDREVLYVTTNGGLGIADAKAMPGGMLARVQRS